MAEAIKVIDIKVKGRTYLLVVFTEIVEMDVVEDCCVSIPLCNLCTLFSFSPWTPGLQILEILTNIMVVYKPVP